MRIPVGHVGDLRVWSHIQVKGLFRVFLSQ